MHADVIVIGGGLSGLAAAVDLSARGYEVEVLEQRGKFASMFSPGLVRHWVHG